MNRDHSPGERAVWRWHFYAGMLCIPFILWLACTGTLFLWSPQIEGWIDRPYNHLVYSGPPAPAAQQVRAALAAVPGAKLSAYQLPENARQAAQVVVAAPGGDDVRVYVHPQSLAILKVIGDENRFNRVLFHLHGELRIGNPGSYIVELAASWAIILLLTGLYLWWPRGRGPAGVVWPRIAAGGKLMWRDLHAVTGFWVSLFALFLLITGLPWAAAWGNYFKQIRVLTGTAVAQQDWTSGVPARPKPEEHAEHGGMAGMAGMAGMGRMMPTYDDRAVDTVTTTARRLAFAAPVMLVPPKQPGEAWTVRSDAENRPLRANATVDPASGAVVTREDFADRHIIDRTVGYGVAAHEGRLFGLPNQILGTLVALGLITLSVSAAIFWWRRRPPGGFGAPELDPGDRLPRPIKAAAVLLAVLLPMFAASALVLWLGERLRRALRHARA